MGSLYKQKITRYLDAEGRRVKAGTAGARKLVEQSRKWYGQYVDAAGVVKREPLCADKAAARQMLAAIERDVARGHAGLTDPYAAHTRAPVAGHVAAYAEYLTGKSRSAKHRAETIRRLNAVLAACGARALGDVTTEGVEAFLASLRKAKPPASARTRQTYLASVKAFLRWARKSKRIGSDPLEDVEAPQGKAVRVRRALTEAELIRLLEAARERPLIEMATQRRGTRAGQAMRQLKPETIARCELAGRERALIYKFAVLTGLRRGEMEAVRVADLDLASDPPSLHLPGDDTKSGEDARMPLRADLAGDLQSWIADAGKGPDDRVFAVPYSLVQRLKQDLAHAGIPYRDGRGRVVDIHALRHTAASHLAKGKVAPRMAQRFMRHSRIDLTLGTYTDADLLDQSEALDALPGLPLGDRSPPEN